MRAICLEQVGKIDHSVFPLAISDSEDGAKSCLDELGMPKEVLSAQVVTSPIRHLVPRGANSNQLSVLKTEVNARKH